MGAALRKTQIPRDQLFIQTKYTYAESQDRRLPYDPGADYPTQVRQSFASSLEHLGVEQIDSLILHGPRARSGLSQIDREVWRTMEEIQREDGTRLIGISNAEADQVELLCEISEVRPAFVQNRCYAQLGWDREVREVCSREGIVYQGFSLLTANVRELKSAAIGQIAERHQTTRTRVIFAFALQVGMICLNGTTQREHMLDDLAAVDVELSEEEISAIETISG